VIGGCAPVDRAESGSLGNCAGDEVVKVGWIENGRSKRVLWM